VWLGEDYTSRILGREVVHDHMSYE
jgi:hypothetical protein